MASHDSLFSYKLTRPYPYRWFTWVVAIGGIAATVFFSLLNLAANGYTLSPVYTTDPNTTLADSQWFQKPPWTFLYKLSATCQPQNLALNTQLFTTQLGLTYTLANVWTNGANGSPEMSPSLTYLNNTLEDCSIRNIMLNAENYSKLGNAGYWMWQNSKISAVVECSINNSILPSTFNLTVHYQPAPQADSSTTSYMEGVAAQGAGFLHLDKKKRANIWWGQQLMYLWYFNALEALSETNYTFEKEAPAALTPEDTISRVQLFLAPTGNTNISSYSFFDTTFWFYYGTGGLLGNKPDGAVQMNQSLHTADVDLDVGFQIDRFAKAFYSTILADLGQSRGPNVVADSDLVQQYLQNTLKGTYIPGCLTKPVNECYVALNGSNDNLAITDSTLYAQYVCQVPQRKGIGSLLIAILVADMVFIQALYTILTWATDLWLKHKDHTSQVCEGCVKLHALLDKDKATSGVGLLSVRPDRSRSASPASISTLLSSLRKHG